MRNVDALSNKWSFDTDQTDMLSRDDDGICGLVFFWCFYERVGSPTRQDTLVTSGPERPQKLTGENWERNPQFHLGEETPNNYHLHNQRLPSSSSLLFSLSSSLLSRLFLIQLIPVDTLQTASVVRPLYPATSQILIFLPSSLKWPQYVVLVVEDNT